MGCMPADDPVKEQISQVRGTPAGSNWQRSQQKLPIIDVAYQLE